MYIQCKGEINLSEMRMKGFHYDMYSMLFYLKKIRKKKLKVVFLRSATQNDG